MVREEFESPQKTIEKVQKGLDVLKKKAEKQKAISSDTFLKSLASLTDSLNQLSELFKEAAKDIKEEEETAAELRTKIEPLLKRIDALEDENKKIAQGILTVADMIKELEEKMEKPKIPKPSMPPGPTPPRLPGAAPIPKPSIPREMPTPQIPPRPPFPPRMPPMPEALKERPAAPRPEMPMPRMPERPEFPHLGPLKIPEYPEIPPISPVPPPGIPTPAELPLPPIPPQPKKKGFLARLLGR